jgi:hypothetical protein
MATIEYMNVYTPANASSFYKFIIKMAEFDVLPTDDIFEGIYNQLNIDLESVILKSRQENGRSLAKKKKKNDGDED